MRNVSERFLRTARSGDQTIVQKAEVIDLAGEAIEELPIESGSATEDGTATVRHDFQLDCIDEHGRLRPSSKNPLIQPPYTRLRLSQGFAWPDAPEELTTVQTAWITGVSADTDGELVTLRGFDRMARLQKPARAPVNIPAGMPAGEALRLVLWAADPTVLWLPDESIWSFPRLSYEIETDLASQAVELAESIGSEVFITREDMARLRPIPTATGTPAASFEEGESCVVVSGSAEWETDGVPNGVIVTAQHSSMSEAVRGEAWAVDPDSPEANPKFVRTEKATTKAQADAMAAGILERELGGSREITLSIFPNPALEEGDVIEVVLPSLGIDVAERFVLSRGSLPWGSPDELQQVTIRAGVLS